MREQTTADTNTETLAFDFAQARMTTRGAAKMAIAKLTVEVAIAHAQSIKDRRQVVRSLKDKLRHGFNVSVAELDDASLWNRATLGVVAISGSSDYLTGQMREVDDALARMCNGLGAEIVDSWVEMLGE
ncbi:MAG: DUF503 domain-containing protein [Acidobacteriaceae bacterium]